MIHFLRLYWLQVIAFVSQVISETNKLNPKPTMLKKNRDDSECLMLQDE